MLLHVHAGCPWPPEDLPGRHPETLQYLGFQLRALKNIGLDWQRNFDVLDGTKSVAFFGCVSILRSL